MLPTPVSRGKVAFLLDNDPGLIRDAYIAGRPNLERRVLFTNSRIGFQDAAFVKRNEPGGANTAQIQKLVRAGYLVRTRSDVPLTAVLSGDTTQLAAALDKGRLDRFPVSGMAARYDSVFVAQLPNGAVARCNPSTRAHAAATGGLNARAGGSFATRRLLAVASPAQSSPDELPSASRPTQSEP